MRRFAIIFISALACVCLLLARSAQAEATFACQPGATYSLKGTAPANTALLLFFDGRPVGGSTSDASGAYRVRLTIGAEAPGAYPIAVEVRGTHQVITSATCIIPVPGTPVSNAVGVTAPSPTPNAQRGSQPTPSTGIASTATVSPTPNGSATAVAQTRGTSTPANTAATATVTSTGTQPTATQTSTGTQSTSTASPTGSVTATASPTVSPTTGSSDDEPTLNIDSDESPEAGKDLVLAGDVPDGDGNELSNIAVNVTYAYEGFASSAWCSTTTDADGNWTCTKLVDAALKDKEITWTATITLNGKTYTEDYDDTPQ